MKNKMLLSKILSEMGVEHKIFNEKPFDSLGLVGYYGGSQVCTFAENAKYISQVANEISMIITNSCAGNLLKGKTSQAGICIVNDPRMVFFKLHNYLVQKNYYPMNKTKTIIGESAYIGDKAIISPYNVCIGENVVIEDNAIINEGCTIGDNSIVRSGSVVGGQGFEFKRTEDDIFLVRHVGKVILGKNVEVQYNTCIDRAIYPWDATQIDDYTKVDNLVHIAHGVKVGKRTMIVANTGIGGRTCIGDDCWLGFGSTIRNGLTIGDNARVNMGAVVTKSVEPGESVSGNFAIEHKKFIENIKSTVV